MPLCDTLLRIAEAGLYRLHLTQEILNETTRNLVQKNRMTEKKAVWFQQQIQYNFPESLVKDYESLIPLMTNDPKDRHVLAAAVKIKADVIVTFNLKDFPSDSLDLFGIKAQSPDDFLIDLFSNCGMDIGVDIIKKQAAALKKPPLSIRDVIVRLNYQAPKFTQCILYCEYGNYLENIALKILDLIGHRKTNKAIYYQEKEYYLEESNKNLTIKHKNKGEILKHTEEGIKFNFTIQDLEKFERFEQELDKQFDN